MSVLVILLPARERLASRTGDAVPAARVPAEFDFVLSADGRSVSSSGRAAPALWPKAASVVAVLADADVAWHRVEIPKAAPARLRAALSGAMEEALLDDDEALHLALGPGAGVGRTGWVAVMHKPWLQLMLAGIEGRGQIVERLVPSSAPVSDAAHGHFFSAEAGADGATALVLSSPAGVTCMRLAGGLARALLPAPELPVRWTASPAAAAAAERWIGAPVALLGDAERALQATRNTVNLRQFDLAPRTRGTRALRAGARRFLSPQWAAARAGLLALLVVQLVGMNAAAWQQRRAHAEQRLAMAQLLREAHPGVRAVLDAPVQMQRETERLRAAAGRPGDGDLEVLLAAAAGAWPDGQGPVQTLRFESGRLTLAAPGWGPPELAQFRQRLASSGYSAELAEGRISVSRTLARATAV